MKKFKLLFVALVVLTFGFAFTACVGAAETTDAQAPTISAQPQSVSMYVGADGSDTELSVTAAVTDGGALSYQWYSNTANSATGGTAVEDETARTLTLDVDTTAAAVNYYYVVVTNTNDEVNGETTAAKTSAVAKVEVVELPEDAAMPTISTQPAATSTVGRNESLTLTVAAATSDLGTLSYQWYSNATAVTDGAIEVGGATEASLEVDTSALGDVYYYCVVTNTNEAATETKVATVNSAFAKVTVETAAYEGVYVLDATNPENIIIDELAYLKTNFIYNIYANYNETTAIEYLESLFADKVWYDDGEFSLDAIGAFIAETIYAQEGVADFLDGLDTPVTEDEFAAFVIAAFKTEWADDQFLMDDVIGALEEEYNSGGGNIVFSSAGLDDISEMVAEEEAFNLISADLAAAVASEEDDAIDTFFATLDTEEKQDAFIKFFTEYEEIPADLADNVDGLTITLSDILSVDDGMEATITGIDEDGFIKTRFDDPESQEFYDMFFSTQYLDGKIIFTQLGGMTFILELQEAEA